MPLPTPYTKSLLVIEEISSSKHFFNEDPIIINYLINNFQASIETTNKKQQVLTCYNPHTGLSSITLSHFLCKCQSEVFLQFFISKKRPPGNLINALSKLALLGGSLRFALAPFFWKLAPLKTVKKAIKNQDPKRKMFEKTKDSKSTTEKNNYRELIMFHELMKVFPPSRDLLLSLRSASTDLQRENLGGRNQQLLAI